MITRGILKQTRETHGFTQIYIADYLNMARYSYQRIEYGKHGTSEENWVKLFNLFGRSVPIEQLMKKDEAASLLATATRMLETS